MATNLELTPQELTMYLYRNSKDDKAIALIRLDDKCYAVTTERKDFKTEAEWKDSKNQIIRMCFNSMNFYQRHGIDYQDAPEDTKRVTYKLKSYPLVEGVTDELIASET